MSLNINSFFYNLLQQIGQKPKSIAPMKSLFILIISTIFSLNLMSATFVVTLPDDSFDGVCDGNCSLLDAIQEANANPGLDIITFAVDVSIVNYPSPIIFIDPVFLDGSGFNVEISTTNFVGSIIFSGSSDGSTITGINFTSSAGIAVSADGQSDITLECNTFNNSGGAAIDLANGANHSIYGNIISNSSGSGINVFNCDNLSISTNTITGGGTNNAINIFGSENLTILNNLVGIDGTGNTSTAIGNGGIGIYLSGCPMAQIIGNTVSNNGYHGIMLAGGSDNSVIFNNNSGVDQTGTISVPNGWNLPSPAPFTNSSSALIIEATDNVTVGGPGMGNIFAASVAEYGIFLNDACGIIIQNNFIGTDPSISIDLGNTAGGIILQGGSINCNAGTENDIQFNDIVFNGGVPIDPTNGNSVIQNNNFSAAEEMTVVIPICSDGVCTAFDFDLTSLNDQMADSLGVTAADIEYYLGDPNQGSPQLITNPSDVDLESQEAACLPGQLANSVTDFDGTGTGDWSYLKSTSIPYNFFNTTPLPDFGSLNGSATNAWTDGLNQIWDDGMHPGSGANSLTIRRWTSNINGLVKISGEYADIELLPWFGDNSCDYNEPAGMAANGQIVSIYFNDNSTGSTNNQIFNQVIKYYPTEANPGTYCIYQRVDLGDVIDFVLDPNNDNSCDHTLFTVEIDPITATYATSPLSGTSILLNPVFLEAPFLEANPPFPAGCVSYDLVDLFYDPTNSMNDSVIVDTTGQTTLADLTFYDNDGENIGNLLANSVVTFVGVDTFFIVATLGSGCADTIEYELTIQSNDSPGLDNDITICPNNLDVINLIDSLNGTPAAGGNWVYLETGGGQTPVGDTFDPAADPAGDYQYNLITCLGETAPVLTIEFFNEPVVGTSQAITICSSAPFFNILDSLTNNSIPAILLPSATMQGTFTFNGSATNENFNPGINAPGDYTFTANDMTCGEISATLTVNVVEEPTISVTDIACDGPANFTIDLLVGETGTTYDLIISPAVAGFPATIAGNTTENISIPNGDYTISAEAQGITFACSSSIDNIINPACNCPVVTTEAIDQMENFCSTGMADLASAEASIVIDGGVANPLDGGIEWFTDVALTIPTGSLTPTVTHDGIDNCAAQTVTFYAAVICTDTDTIAAGTTTVTVYPQPQTPTLDAVMLDANQNCVYNVSPACPGDGLSPPEVTIAPDDPAGMATITVTSNIPGTECNTTVDFDLNYAACPSANCPSLATIALPDTICQGTNIELDDDFTGTADPGAWTVFNAPALSSFGPNDPISILNTTIEPDGQYIFTYTLSGAVPVGCDEFVRDTVYIDSQKDASFDLDASFCLDGMTNPAPTNFNAGGIFSISASVPNDGGVATIDAATGELSDPVAGTTYTIDYDFTGLCGDNGSASIEIQESATIMAIYTELCEALMVDLDTIVSFSEAGTSEWFFGPGLNPISDISTNPPVIDLADLITASSSIDLIVNYTTTAGGCETSFSFTLDFLEQDVTDFSYPAPVCVGSNVSPDLVAGFTTGGTFTLTSTGTIPPGMSIDAATGEIINPQFGLYTVEYETGGACANMGTANISVQNNNLGTTDVNLCENEMVTLSDYLPNGFPTDGTWFSLPGNVALMDDEITVSVDESYFYDAAIAGICPIVDTLNISVINAPDITISQIECVDANNFVFSLEVGELGTQYNVSLSPPNSSAFPDDVAGGTVVEIGQLPNDDYVVEVEIPNPDGGTCTFSSLSFTNPNCTCPVVTNLADDFIEDFCEMGTADTAMAASAITFTDPGGLAEGIEWFTDAALTTALASDVFTHSGVDNCITETITIFAGLLCTNSNPVAAGQLTINLYPPVLAPTLSGPVDDNGDCVYTIVPNCPTDDLSDDTFTLMPGDPAGDFTGTVSSTITGNTCPSDVAFELAYTACSSLDCLQSTFNFSNPSTDNLCTGGIVSLPMLGTDFNILDPQNTQVGTITWFTGNDPDNDPVFDDTDPLVHSGTDLCAADAQVNLFAFVECNDGQTVQWVPVAIHNYILFPEVVAPTLSGPVDDNGDCIYTIVPNCPTDDLSDDTFTLMPGDPAGDFTGTVSSAITGNPCPSDVAFELAYTACSSLDCLQSTFNFSNPTIQNVCSGPSVILPQELTDFMILDPQSTQVGMIVWFEGNDPDNDPIFDDTNPVFHSDADPCAPDAQIDLFAFVQCDQNNDGLADEWVPVASHSYIVFPEVGIPTLTGPVDDNGDCVYTIVPNCPTDDLSDDTFTLMPGDPDGGFMGTVSSTIPMNPCADEVAFTLAYSACSSLDCLTSDFANPASENLCSGGTVTLPEENTDFMIIDPQNTQVGMIMWFEGNDADNDPIFDPTTVLVHSGVDDCAADAQVDLFAFVECDNGTTVEWVLVASHSYVIFPEVTSAQITGSTTDLDGNCTYTIESDCPGDDLDITEIILSPNTAAGDTMIIVTSNIPNNPCPLETTNLILPECSDVVCPDVQIDLSLQGICEGETLTLSDLVGTAAPGEWSISTAPAASTYSAGDPLTIFDATGQPDGNYILSYLLTGTIPASCTDQVFGTIQVSANAEASFDLVNDYCYDGLTNPEPENFVAGGTFSILSSTPDDGGLASINPLTGELIDPERNTVYDIQYEFAGLCGDTFNAEINILPQPELNQLYNELCAANLYNLDTLVEFTPTGGTSVWAFIDGTGGEIPIPDPNDFSLDGLDFGTGTVTLVLEYDLNSCIIETGILIDLISQDVVDFSYPTDVCEGEILSPIPDVDFVSGGIFEFDAATPPQGSMSISATNGEISNAASGIYTVNYETTGACGNSFSAQVTITANNQIEVNDTTICSGSDLDLNDITVELAGGDWLLIDGSPVANTTLTNLTTNQQFIYSNNTATCLISDTLDITIIEEPTIVTDGISCVDADNFSFNLTVGTAGTTYEISVSPNIPGFPTDIDGGMTEMIDAPNGDYTISVTSINPNGENCTVESAEFNNPNCACPVLGQLVQDSLHFCEMGAIDTALYNAQILGNITDNADQFQEFAWFSDAALTTPITMAELSLTHPGLLANCDRIETELYAAIICETDPTNPIPAGNINAFVYPNTSMLMSTLEQAGVCGPTISSWDCSASDYIVENSYDNNGANPDFSLEAGGGPVTFTIFNPNYPDEIRNSDCGDVEVATTFLCAADCPSIDAGVDEQFLCQNSQAIEPFVSVFNDNTNPVIWLTEPGNILSEYDFAVNTEISCAPVVLEIYAHILCDDDLNPNTNEVLLDLAFTHTITFYPTDLTPYFTINENASTCTISVDIDPSCGTLISQTSPMGAVVVPAGQTIDTTFVFDYAFNTGFDPLTCLAAYPIEVATELTCAEDCPENISISGPLAVCSGVDFQLEALFEIDAAAAVEYVWTDLDGIIVGADQQMLTSNVVNNTCDIEIHTYTVSGICNGNPIALEGPMSNTIMIEVYPEIDVTVPVGECNLNITDNCNNGLLTIEYFETDGTPVAVPPTDPVNGAELVWEASYPGIAAIDPTACLETGSVTALCTGCPTLIQGINIDSIACLSISLNYEDFEPLIQIEDLNNQFEAFVWFTDEDLTNEITAPLEQFINSSCEPSLDTVFVAMTCASQPGLNIPVGQINLVIYPQDITPYVSSTGDNTCETTVVIDNDCNGYLTVDGDASTTNTAGTDGNNDYVLIYDYAFGGGPCPLNLQYSIPFDCPLDCPTDLSIVQNDTVVCSGSIVNLSATVQGTGSVVYNWILNGLTIQSDANPDLVINDLDNSTCDILTRTYTLQAVCNGQNVLGQTMQDTTFNLTVYPEMDLNLQIGNCVLEVLDNCPNNLAVIEYDDGSGTWTSSPVANPANGDELQWQAYYPEINGNNDGAQDCLMNGMITATCTGCPSITTALDSSLVVCDLYNDDLDNLLPFVSIEDTDGQADGFDWYTDAGFTNMVNPTTVSLENMNCAPLIQTYFLALKCSSQPGLNIPAGEFTVTIYPSDITPFVSVTGDGICNTGIALDADCTGFINISPTDNIVHPNNTSGIDSFFLDYPNNDCFIQPFLVEAPFDCPLDCPDNINPIISTICAGSSVEIGTSVYTESGIYSDTLQTTSGCDSIVNLTLTVAPSANISLVNGQNEICTGGSIEIEFNLDGGTNFPEVVYSNGIQNFTLNNISDGETITVNPVDGNEYFIVSAMNDFADACSNGLGDTLTVDIVGSPTFSNIGTTCAADELTYIVTFEIADGDEDTWTVLPAGGDITGNLYTSLPVTSGDAFEFQLFDTNNCDTAFIIGGAIDCGCITSAGTMVPANLMVCDGEEVFAQSNGDFTIDPSKDDIGVFVLHDNPGTSLGDILESNTTAFFNSDTIPSVVFGTTYYISFVVAGSTNGILDLADPCLSVAQGVPVVFHENPIADAGADESICDLNVDLSATASVGVGTWSLIDGPVGAVTDFSNVNAANSNFESDVIGVYELEWTENNNSCEDRDSVVITFNQLEYIDLPDTTICETALPIFMDLLLPAGFPYNYNWYTDNGGQPDLGNPILNSEITTTTYWLVYSDIDDCENMDSFTITENCACPVVNTPLDATETICGFAGTTIDLTLQNNNVDLTNSSTAIFIWRDEDGNIIDPTMETMFPVAHSELDCGAETFNFTLEIQCSSDPGFSEDGGTFAVVSYPEPNNTMYDLPDECETALVPTCTNGNISVTYITAAGSSDTPPVFEDGITSIDINFQLFIDGAPANCFVAGAYQATCAPVVCPFTVSDTIICAGESVQLNDLTDAPDGTYGWFDPDDFAGGPIAPIVDISTPEVYALILSLNCTDTLYASVDITTPADAGTGENIAVCNDTTLINLFDLLIGGDIDGTWSLEPGSDFTNPGAFDPIAGTFDPNGHPAGNYQFEYLVIPDPFAIGCSDSTLVSIDLNIQPEIIVPDQTFCTDGLEADDLTITFTVGDGDGTITLFEDNAGVPGPEVTSIDTDGATYWLSYEEDGCSVTQSFMLTESCDCPSAISAEADFNICSGTTFSLNAIPEDGNLDLVDLTWFDQNGIQVPDPTNVMLPVNTECDDTSYLFIVSAICSTTGVGINVLDTGVEVGVYTQPQAPEIVQLNNSCDYQIIPNCPSDAIVLPPEIEGLIFNLPPGTGEDSIQVSVISDGNCTDLLFAPYEPCELIECPVDSIFFSACFGAMDTLNLFDTLATELGGGLFYLGGPGNDPFVQDSLFDIGQAAIGTYEFTYDFDFPITGCTPNQLIFIEVNSGGAISNGQNDTICVGNDVEFDLNTLLDAGTMPGNWIEVSTVPSTGTAFDSVGESFNGFGQNIAVYDFAYLIPSDQGCDPDSVFVSVEVLDQPVIPTADFQAVFCPGDAISDVTAMGDANAVFAWYDQLPIDPANEILTNISGTSNEIYTPAQIDTFYLVQIVGGCVSDPLEIELSQENGSFAGIDSLDFACLTSTTPINMIDLLPGIDNTGTWEELVNTNAGFDAGTGVLDPSDLDLGTYDFQYILGSAGVCGPDTSIVSIEIQDTAQFMINLPDSVCNATVDGSTIDLDLIFGSNFDGTWANVSGPQTVDLSNLPVLDFDGMTPGAYVLEFTITGDPLVCGNSTFQTSINVVDCNENCPDFIIDVVPDVCVDAASVDLSAFELNVPPGSWSLTDGPAGFDPGILTGDILDPTGADAGLYSATYTSDMDLGVCPDSVVVQFEILEPALAGTGSDSTVCNISLIIDLNGLVIDPSPTAVWFEFGSNPEIGIVGESGMFNVEAVAEGQYTFYLVQDNGVCLNDTATVNVNVIAGPATELTTGQACNLAGENTFFNLNDLILSGETDGVWSDPNMTGLDLSNPSSVDFGGFANGNYTLQFDLNDLSCGQVSYQTTVLVSPVPCNGCPTLEALPLPILCATNAQQVLTNFILGDLPGSWSITSLPPGSNPLILDEDGQTLIALQADPGDYELTFTTDSISNNPDCPSSSSTILTVVAPPFAGENVEQTVCNSDNIDLDLQSLIIGEEPGGIWAPGTAGLPAGPGLDSINATFNPFGLEAGRYIVEYTLFPTEGCTQSKSQVIISVQEEPSLSILEDIVICETVPDSLIYNLNDYLIVENANDISGTWIDDDLIGTGVPIADFLNVEPGTYTFTFEPDYLCNTDPITLNVTVEPCQNWVAIPNAFSPNNDGSNDLFRAKGRNISSINFKVFSRWGQMLFESNVYDDGWDGFHNREPQEMGVYIYFVNITYENGETEKLKGDFTLLR